MRRRDLLVSAWAPWLGRRSDFCVIERNGRTLSVYREAEGAELVLVTHARRDAFALGRGSRAELVAPEAEAELWERPEEFWKAFLEARYHDYAAINTKVPIEPVRIARKVRDGDRIDWQGLRFEVAATPGWTPGAVSYLVELDGRRVAYTGGLILAGGRLLDLVSLQEAIPELKLRAYHGYAARASQLTASLRRLAAWRPDVLVPAHGEPILEPQAAIEALLARLRRVFTEHFSTDALRWYFGEEHWRRRAGRLLEGAAPNPMSMAETLPLPGWIRPIGNSRLIVSESGEAWLVDCGYDKVIEELEELRRQDMITRLAGIFVTHYHDDHTDRVAQCAARFNCPVYAEERQRTVLEQPWRFYLPCLTTEPVRRIEARRHGGRMKWREFELTFLDFPGQTYYHSALLVRRAGNQTVCFIGDSFTPSGLDDYCLRNRCLLGDDDGYLRCLRLLEELPPRTFLINQHVEPMFRFSRAQIEFMKASMERRRAAVAELTPWPHPSFAVDDQWVRFDPYEWSGGAPVRPDVVVLNHAARPLEFELRLKAPEGWSSPRPVLRATLAPRRESRFPLELKPPPGAAGLYVLTASVRLAGIELENYPECLVRLR